MIFFQRIIPILGNKAKHVIIVERQSVRLNRLSLGRWKEIAMTDWIKEVADDNKRRSDAKEQAARELREIRGLSGALKKELESRVLRIVDDANKQLYGGTNVLEIRHDMGRGDEKRANDFVVMTADYPAATMYVKLHPELRIITRLLSTAQAPGDLYRQRHLRDLRIMLGENKELLFEEVDETAKGPLKRVDKGVTILWDLDEVVRLIVQPVVAAHTGKSVAAKILKRPQSQAVTLHSAQRGTERAEFGFVVDSKIATILARDYAELQNLDPNKSVKSVLVLSGGIIEGLLFDALVANGNYTFEGACNEPLKNMIHPALKEKMIRQDRLTDVLRSYRNLIHPAREVKDNVRFTTSDAKLAIAAVDIILREVVEWHISRKPP